MLTGDNGKSRCTDIGLRERSTRLLNQRLLFDIVSMRRGERISQAVIMAKITKKKQRRMTISRSITQSFRRPEDNPPTNFHPARQLYFLDNFRNQERKHMEAQGK